MKKVTRALNLTLALVLVLLLTVQPYGLAAQTLDGEHQHDENCGYAEATPCLHEHEESCGYADETAEVPCTLECEGDGHAEGCTYAPAVAAAPCTCQHDESGSDTEGTPCLHEHEESCGYADGTPEVPCTLGCEGDAHAEGCAYAPAVAGLPCTHQHDNDCGYAEGTPAPNEHEEGCDYTEGAPEVPCVAECEGDHAEGCAYAPAAAGAPCTHQHDEDCGYVEGSACTMLPEDAGMAAVLNAPMLLSDGVPYTGQTTAGTYTISTAAQLAKLALVVDSGFNYSGSTFQLTADIDLSVSDAYDTLTWPGGNWEPIGSDSNQFSGTFDGQFHKIINMNINTPAGMVGLFARTENAVIKNLGLERVAVISSGVDVGGLIGNDVGESQISRCYVIGAIQAEGGCGGLLGSTHGNDDARTIVTDCFVRVSLWAGGGTADSSGISGWNYANGILITNSYGAATGEKRPLAGWSDGSSVEAGNFVSAYYDATLSPALMENTVLGRSSSQLRTQDTFENWDFSTIWAIDPLINGGYPYLLGMEPDPAGAPGLYTTGLDSASQTTVANGAVQVQPGYALLGDTITITLTPDAGYEVDSIGANKKGDAGTAVDLTNTEANVYTYEMPAYDVDVTVTYKIATYAITYNGLEGATHANPSTYIFGTGVSSLADPSARPGFTFMGWYDAETDGNKVESIAATDTGDKTLWARWMPDPVITVDLPLEVRLDGSDAHYNISVSALNAVGGYQWYRADGTRVGGVVDIGATTSSLDIGAAGAGQYYVMVYGVGGISVQSKSCTVVRSSDVGTVIVDVQPAPDIPATSVLDGDALIDAVLNDAEKDDVRHNDVTYTVILSVAASTTNADTATAEQKASDDGHTVAAHYNITVDIYKDAVHVRNITSLSSAITLVMDVPVELQKAGRTFALVRVHDGTPVILLDEDSSDSTITVTSDSFSVYTLVYKDNVGSSYDTVVASPQTGDNSGLGLWVVMLISSLAVLGMSAAVYVRQRRRGNTAQ